MKVLIDHSSGVDRVEHISSEIDRDLNRMNVANIVVLREEVDFPIIEFEDEILLKDDDGSTIFSGVISQQNKKDGVIEFNVESFERLAKDAKPLPSSFPFENATDRKIINGVLDELDEIDPDTIQNLDNNLTIDFHNVSPGKAIRKIREITKGEIKYTKAKRLKYVSELGYDKTGTVLSPRLKNVSSIQVNTRSKSNKMTHIRMLGAGSGINQVVAESVADNYDPDAEKERWMTKLDKTINYSNMLKKKGDTIINEKYEVREDIRVVARQPITVNLGDKFTIDYPEEDVNNEQLRAVEVKEIYDSDGERYEAVFSNIEKERDTQVERTRKNMREQAVEEEFSSFGLPQYVDPNSAPADTGVIYVTGESNSYPRGIYTYNPDEGKWERGANQNLSNLTDRVLRNQDLKYGDGTNDVIYDYSEGFITPQVLPTVSFNHGDEIDAPPNAHHPTPKVEVGYIFVDTDRAPGYINTQSIGFKPQYIEFHSTFNKQNIGNTYEENENELEEFITTGHSYGVGHSQDDDDQVVSMNTTSPGYPRGNKSHIDDGYVVYLEREEYQGSGIYNTQRVKGKIYNTSGSGFRVEFEKNEFDASIIYKAFR